MPRPPALRESIRLGRALLTYPAGPTLADGLSGGIGEIAFEREGLPLQHARDQLAGAAEVVVVEPTGADTQIYCRCNDQEVTATIRDRTDVRAGDRIRLVPDIGRAHLFDTASGKRLVA